RATRRRKAGRDFAEPTGSSGDRRSSVFRRIPAEGRSVHLDDQGLVGDGRALGRGRAAPGRPRGGSFRRGWTSRGSGRWVGMKDETSTTTEIRRLRRPPRSEVGLDESFIDSRGRQGTGLRSRASRSPTSGPAEVRGRSGAWSVTL